MVPTDCLCHKTCDHVADTVTVCPRPGSTECQKGCQCPEGTAMNNGTCVKESDCPCIYKDKFYKLGEKVPLPGVHCADMVCTAKGMTKIVDHQCTTPETCKNGRVFQHCPCERTCSDDAHTCDQSHCIPGCACAMNLVWNGERCVEPRSCTCTEGNVTYADEQHWDVGECVKCHCVQGRKQCSEICRITEEMCRKQGKKLFNKDLKDGSCCRCVSDEPHCMHSGEEKPIGAVWHKGLCETYTCTKTAYDTGMITVTRQACPTCSSDEVKEYVANKCCPVCRKKTQPETTPTTKPPQKCKEVFEDDQDFVDLRVDLQPENKGQPSDLRPISGKGWPVLMSDKPSVTLVLSTNDDTRAGRLEKLSVIGNVKTVTIKYTTTPETLGKPDSYKPYNKGQPINVESGEVAFVDETDSTKSGLNAFKVLVTIDQAVKPDLPLNLKLKVFACVEDIPEPCNDWEIDEYSCSNVLSSPGSRVTLEPSGSPSDLTSGWKVPSSETPVVTINLASEDGQKPGLLQTVNVNGNVKTVKIEYSLVGDSDSGFLEYNNGEPVILKNGQIVFDNEFTKKVGILVHELRVTVLSPVDSAKDYNIKMSTNACVQDKVKSITKQEYDDFMKQLKST